MSENAIHRIAVLGAGTMGHGIAQVCAMAGYGVALHDPQPGAVERGLKTITQNLVKGVERGKVAAEVRDRAVVLLREAADVADAVHDVELVIEAAPECLEINTRMFAEVDRYAPQRAIVLEMEKEAQLRCFRSADASEGIAALNEKRPAVFRGA